MTRTTTVIIGAGHAGLAMSRRLSERSIDHVVVERGEVANSWRTERWSSLRLLTPNWQTRLPGLDYQGDDPDGYMPVSELVDHLAGYAERIDAPVHSDTTVTGLRRNGSGFEVDTDQGRWLAPTVVLASGACNLASLPSVAAAVPRSLVSVTGLDYRGPDQLPDKGVLVVGASATGAQLADELQASGRAVTLSAGEHVRLPRLYRAHDIFWWMDQAGVLDERHDQVDDLVRTRHLPSPQLIGTPERRTLDLNVLAARGVRIVGRLGRITNGVAQFSGSLPNIGALADLKMNRLLDRFDQWASETGLDHHVNLDRPHRLEPTRFDRAPVLDLDLTSGEIGAIVWATGYRPDYSWVEVPVIGPGGRIQHHGGVIDGAPGLYVLGTPVLRRRRSTYINGAAPDTSDLANHLHAYLDLDAAARTHRQSH